MPYLTRPLAHRGDNQWSSCDDPIKKTLFSDGNETDQPLWFWQCVHWPAKGSDAKPNVLFIAIDDLRPELGCFDVDHIKSPNIDRLAAQGTVFKRAYCQVAVCGASRASLLTGLRPTPTRFLTYKTYAQDDAPGAMTLPEEFRKNGYHCISNGKIFHHRADTARRS